ncbi:hypothetical protein P154DRAFT_523092 [Amniculicola lignicola CBS 123094]|uniref:Zn(2)-C6 fungal-type domain-containing protein n=1 Tax=Amniculicola lignicola CBS 123094 TaxID=1392246 RepID=A0A6A5WD30_9PLEO|nr:hypothetical protein P154DRAFT_523092 [Amniculicola lignicola CBS 123094]
MSQSRTVPSNSVCSLCRSRKVKCDRDDPCGNCVDGGILCVRTPRSTSKRRRSADPVKSHDAQSINSPSTHSASLPHTPSMAEAQEFIQLV